MQKEFISKRQKSFEDCAKNTDGIEFWSARDLQKLLDYEKWDNFLKVIEKAQVACRNSNQKTTDHFADVRKMVQLGSG
ncbi:hypothetical protein HY495_01235 [Candidatus Woesearchaeota archaeon]|nr:hypothetical protein [Candidatus Woesearchaeota archaeon]